MFSGLPPFFSLRVPAWLFELAAHCVGKRHSLAQAPPTGTHESGWRGDCQGDRRVAMVTQSSLINTRVLLMFALTVFAA